MADDKKLTTRAADFSAWYNAARLRAAGARVEYPLRAQAVAKQKKAAFHAGARRIVRAVDDEYEIEVLADGARTRVRGEGWMHDPTT